MIARHSGRTVGDAEACRGGCEQVLVGPEVNDLLVLLACREGVDGTGRPHGLYDAWCSVVQADGFLGEPLTDLEVGVLEVHPLTDALDIERRHSSSSRLVQVINHFDAVFTRLDNGTSLVLLDGCLKESHALLRLV